MSYSLDIESFEKMVDKMGSDHVTYGMTPPGREMTKATTNTPSVVPTTISQSRLATAGTNTRKPKEVRPQMNNLSFLHIHGRIQRKGQGSRPPLKITNL